MSRCRPPPGCFAPRTRTLTAFLSPLLSLACMCPLQQLRNHKQDRFSIKQQQVYRGLRLRRFAAFLQPSRTTYTEGINRQQLQQLPDTTIIAFGREIRGNGFTYLQSMDFQRELQSKHHLNCEQEKPAHCHGSLLLRLGTHQIQNRTRDAHKISPHGTMTKRTPAMNWDHAVSWGGGLG